MNQGDGRTLHAMFAAATAMLTRKAAAINALNVFPVPDGDTGTNMLLTMRASMEAINGAEERGATAVLSAMARGAMMGARGNSGVILSQILKGMAKALEDKETFDGAALAAAFKEASIAAYRSVSRPVEGTILTVMREAAEAAQIPEGSPGDDLVGVLERATIAARDSLARTPLLLQVLREAGVVDAGGEGLCTLLEGALRALRGEAVPVEEETVTSGETPRAIAFADLSALEERSYGHCTEFLLEGEDLDPDRVRSRMLSLGDSVLVVGDESLLRVHLHTSDPETALSYARGLGTLHQVKVENIDQQHQEFLALQRSRIPAGGVGVIAVAQGEGLWELFRSLGALVMVPGGETMNPSTQELLTAILSVPTEKVVLLPNNPNIFPAAQQACSCELEGKRVAVVPARSIPQGIAAMLAYNSEHGLEENVAAMEKAMAKVRTLEITQAVRDASFRQQPIRTGQYLALLERELCVVGDDLEEVLLHSLEEARAGEAEVITLYWGQGVSPEQAEQAAQGVRQYYPEVQVDLVPGGQPHYPFIVSLE